MTTQGQKKQDHAAWRAISAVFMIMSIGYWMISKNSGSLPQETVFDEQYNFMHYAKRWGVEYSLRDDEVSFYSSLHLKSNVESVDKARRMAVFSELLDSADIRYDARGPIDASQIFAEMDEDKNESIELSEFLNFTARHSAGILSRSSRDYNARKHQSLVAPSEAEVDCKGDPVEILAPGAHSVSVVMTNASYPQSLVKLGIVLVWCALNDGTEDAMGLLQSWIESLDCSTMHLYIMCKCALKGDQGPIEVRRFAAQVQIMLRAKKVCVTVYPSLPNVGREAHGFLHYILQHYDSGFHSLTLFSQAKIGPFPADISNVSPSDACLGFASLGETYCAQEFIPGWEQSHMGICADKTFTMEDVNMNLWTSQVNLFRFSTGHRSGASVPPWIIGANSQFLVSL